MSAETLTVRDRPELAAPPRREIPADGRRPRTPREKVLFGLWFVAAVGVCLVTVFPLLWTVSTSLKPVGEILSSSIDLIPNRPTFENYLEVFSTVPFGRYFVNSLVLSLAGVVLNIFFGAMAGYAFARMRFRGRKALFLMLLSSMMIPGIVTMVPTFLVLRRFPFAGGNDLFGDGGMGFINSYWAVILPGAAGAFAVFFMRQFFASMPEELAEAARLDGASEFRIFAQIYLPLAKPGAAVLGILTFQAGWNNFMWPLIVLNDPDLLTVQVGLAAFKTDYTTDYGPLMAGTVIVSLPVLIIFLMAQRYIVEGVAKVGIK